MSFAARHDRGNNPPQGHGYYSSHPASPTGYNDRSDERYNEQYDERYEGYDGGGHQQHSQQQQPYFEPPPREEFPPSAEEQRPRYEHGTPSYQQHTGHDQQPGGYASSRGAERLYEENPSVLSEPLPNDGNQLATFDEEKADAEWRRGVEEAYTYQRRRPPSSATDNVGQARTVYDDDFMRERQLEREERGWERERERQYYEDRERGRAERERDRARRKRRDEDVMREKALRYPSDPKKGGRDIFGSSEGERGLAAKLAGGAAGALIAHEVTDSALGTLSGIVVGALGANVLEKQHERRQEAKLARRRTGGEPYNAAYPQPGRDMEDVRRTGRDRPIRDSEEPRDWSRRRGRSSSGFRDRLRRSLSRARSKSRRRRSESYESEDTHWR